MAGFHKTFTKKTTTKKTLIVILVSTLNYTSILYYLTKEDLVFHIYFSPVFHIYFSPVKILYYIQIHQVCASALYSTLTEGFTVEKVWKLIFQNIQQEGQI